MKLNLVDIISSYITFNQYDWTNVLLQLHPLGVYQQCIMKYTQNIYLLTVWILFCSWKTKASSTNRTLINPGIDSHLRAIITWRGQRFVIGATLCRLEVTITLNACGIKFQWASVATSCYVTSGLIEAFVGPKVKITTLEKVDNENRGL